MYSCQSSSLQSAVAALFATGFETETKGLPIPMESMEHIWKSIGNISSLQFVIELGQLVTGHLRGDVLRTDGRQQARPHAVDIEKVVVHIGPEPVFSGNFRAGIENAT